MPKPIAPNTHPSPLIQSRPLPVGRASGVNPNVIVRANDSASFSGVSRELGALRTMLGRLAGSVSAGGGAPSDRAQGFLDEIRDEIQSLGEHAAHHGRAVTIKSRDVLGASFSFIGENPGGPISVNVEVTQSAQKAGLFLNLGASQRGGAGTINLATDSAFTIELTGKMGTRELSFASTQSLAQIATSINAFYEDTGVTATISGYGIKLSSNGLGSEDFVSVRVTEGTLSDGSGGNAGPLGVFQLEPDDFNDAQSTGVTFQDAINTVRDDGQDVQATINGRPTNTLGNVIVLRGEPFRGVLELSTGAAIDDAGVNAQNLGTFLAAIFDPQPGLGTYDALR